MLDTLHAELRGAVAAALAASRAPAAQYVLLALMDAVDRVLALLSSGLVPERPELGHERRNALLQSAVQELEHTAIAAAPHLPPADARAIERGVRALAAPLHRSQLRLRGAPVARSPSMALEKAAASPGPGVRSLANAQDERLEAAAAPVAERSFHDVRFGASAPGELAPDTPAIARFVAYAADQDVQARALLGADRAGLPHELGAGAARIAAGTEVQVALSGRGLRVDQGDRGVRQLVWTGRPVLLMFEVQAADGRQGACLLRFEVLVEGLSVATLLLQAHFVAQAMPQAAPVLTTGQPVQSKAFASYSSLDRPRVLDRLASIRLFAPVAVFLDCADLCPGETWRLRLEREIDGCDTFLLFWSRPAAESGWVRWEYERALQTRGLPRMQFHPLENDVKPPLALRELHFSDPYADLRWAALQRQAERAATRSS